MSTNTLGEQAAVVPVAPVVQSEDPAIANRLDAMLLSELATVVPTPSTSERTSDHTNFSQPTQRYGASVVEPSVAEPSVVEPSVVEPSVWSPGSSSLRLTFVHRSN